MFLYILYVHLPFIVLRIYYVTAARNIFCIMLNADLMTLLLRLRIKRKGLIMLIRYL